MMLSEPPAVAGGLIFLSVNSRKGPPATAGGSDRMADQLKLEVVTPERRLLSEAVDSVTVPGRNGEMQILPGHAALISELQTGVLAYNQGGTAQQLHVSGGFIEVNNDKVSVLAEIAERPEEIDAARARLAREHTEKQL